MKAILGIILTALFINTPVAQAIWLPGWERPVMRAELELQEDGGASEYPAVEALVMNKRDGSEHATSFTLIEDTGIRCITAPCPSQKESKFIVSRVSIAKNGGSTLYDALEVLEVEPGMIGPMARRLTLMDHTTNGLREFDPAWIVTIQHFGTRQTYVGNPEPLYTIQ